MEAKPIEGKLYIPPLVLESNISELEKTLAEERILIDLEQTVFSTVFKYIDFSKSSKASKSDNMSGLFDDEFDFLNSDGDLDECVAQFDFNAKLPGHSQFVINSFGLSSVYEKGETSTKVDKSVPVKTKVAKGKKKKFGHSQKQTTTCKPKKRHSLDSHSSNFKMSNVSYMRKKKNGVKSTWLPKKKVDEIAKSFSDSSCNRNIDCTSDIIENVASNKQKLFCNKGLEVNFKAKSCSVRTEDGKELLVGTRNSNLYTINLSKVQTDSEVCLLIKASILQSWIWHRRLSHLNFRYINKLVTGKLIKGLPELKYVKEHLCAACEMGKMKRGPRKPRPEQSTSSPLELLHMDLCGPIRTQSIGGKKYVLVIVDDYSRESLNKFSAKADEGGYSQSSAAYSVYLKKSKTVIESVNVTFDEDMASVQSDSEPVLTGVLASGQISPEPVPTKKKSDEASTSNAHLSDLDLLFELFYDEFLGYKVTKSVVVDRMNDSTNNNPIASELYTESNSPV
ncbi:hypothetical protein L6452_37080 [Arctium lappa]|uniref:Uncharacterized protein n=1 Tax=Arctium lappa TaxID=4217 RepID=A0ACB8Y2I9_ARCLA|nr:hypothetical protein L6452_37080 [Arctium lappa]